MFQNYHDIYEKFFSAHIVCIFDSITIYVLQLHTYIVIEKINKLHTQKNPQIIIILSIDIFHLYRSIVIPNKI